MSDISLKKLKRLINRAEKIAESSTNASIQVSIKPLTKVKDDFSANDAEVKRLKTASSKESEEAKEAKKNLSQKYDEVRMAFFAVVPYAALGETASNYTTPDDLIEAANDLEDQLSTIGLVESNPLENGDEGVDDKIVWARVLLRDLTPSLEVAETENTESVEAGNELQKAKKRRAELRGGAEFQLRAFRRVVRKVFGSHSREYHSLKLASLGKDDDDTNEDPTGGTPSA